MGKKKFFRNFFVDYLTLYNFEKLGIIEISYLENIVQIKKEEKKTIRSIKNIIHAIFFSSFSQALHLKLTKEEKKTSSLYY